MVSCDATRRVPNNEYLLNKNSITVKSNDINAADVEPFIQQKPNRKMLSMVPFHLYVYNASHYERERKFPKFIGFYKLGNIIGEAPALLDTAKIEKTKKQFEAYLKNKGYYNAEIKDSIYYFDKRANVTYIIKPNEPYIINNVKTRVKDLGIRPIIINPEREMSLSEGNIFDMDFLNTERKNIIYTLRDSGYYYFNADYIHYEIDSALLSQKVNIDLIVEKYIRYISATDKIEEPHKRYKINSVNIVSPYDLQKSLVLKTEYFNTFEKDSVKALRFLITKDYLVKPKAVARHIYIEPNKWYKLSSVQETNKHLSSLGTYKVVNINFDRTPGKNGYLDCNILLTPFSSQSYTVELEGTNSSGNLGIAGSFKYNHKSLFNGGENFSIKLKGAVEAQTAVGGEDNSTVVPFNTKEFGVSTNIRLPIFLLPLKHDKFIRNNAPKTFFSLSYNYQTRPDYIKNIASSGFGYLWKSKKYFSHKFSLIEISAIKVPYKDSLFITEVLDKNIGLKRSFEDQFITATAYSIIFSNKDYRVNRDYIYTRLNVEFSGNILNAIYSKNGDSPDGEPYKIFGEKFSQYFRFDGDFRYNSVLNKYNKFVYRLYGGIGIPYGNAETLPYEKQFFSGGANGLRGWVVRSLGPGSYYNPNEIRIYQTSDLKLEGNFEYRFKMFWLMEGALFTDVGNIWSINKSETREEAKFYANQFYKQLAVDGGIGLRLDFTFFLLRLDWGFKLRDPKEPDGERWIILDSYNPISPQNNMFNFSIGYPF